MNEKQILALRALVQIFYYLDRTEPSMKIKNVEY